MRNFLETTITIVMGIILTGIILIGFSGCSEKGILQPIDPVLKIHSSSADNLMDNFAKAYGGRDLDLYAQLLHEDFIYTFNPESAKHSGPVYDFFTKEDELITAANMFCGKPIVNSQGRTLAAITDIDFQVWKQEGQWEMAEGMDSAGSLRGVFDCVIHITRDGDSNFTITGQQLFTVILADISDDEGAIQPNYQIIGWQDLTMN